MTHGEPAADAKFDAAVRRRVRFVVFGYLVLPVGVIVVALVAWHLYRPFAVSPQIIGAGPDAVYPPSCDGGYLPGVAPASGGGYESAIPSPNAAPPRITPSIGPGTHAAGASARERIAYYVQMSIRAADGDLDARYDRNVISLSQYELVLARQHFADRSRNDGKLGFLRLGIAQLGADAFEIAERHRLTVPFCPPNDFTIEDERQAFINLSVAARCDKAGMTRANQWLAAVDNFENFTSQERAELQVEAAAYPPQACSPGLLADAPAADAVGPGNSIAKLDFVHQLIFAPDLAPESPTEVRLAPDKQASLSYRIRRKPTPSSTQSPNPGTPPDEAIDPNAVTAPVEHVLTERLDECLRVACKLEVQFTCTVCGRPEDRKGYPGLFARQPLLYDERTETFSTPLYYFTPRTPRSESELREFIPDGRQRGVTVQLLRDGVSFSALHVCVDVGDSDYCQVDNASFEPAGSGSNSVPSDSGSLFGGKVRLAALGTPIIAATPLAQSNTISAPVSVFSAPASAKPDVEIWLQDRVQAPIAATIVFSDRTLAKSVADRIAPTQPNLAKKLREASQLSFDTAYANWASLADNVNRVYLKLSCSITRNEKFRAAIDEEIGNCESVGRLRQLLDSLDQEARASRRTVASENWSLTPGITTRANAVRAEFARLGDDLFDRLFARSTGAHDVVAQLFQLARERTAGTARAIRIKFSSDSVHVPFQLLHVPGAANDTFFGLVFDIAADKQFGILPDAEFVGDGWSQPLNDISDLDPVIGLYTEGRKLASNADCQAFTVGSVGWFGCQHYKSLSKVLGDRFKTLPSEPTVTAKDFMERLKKEAHQTGLIWFYGHGKTRFDWPDKLDVQPLADILAHFEMGGAHQPRLVFDKTGSGSELRSSRIADLGFAERRPKFSQGPLVVLVACELGAAGPSAGGTSGTYMPAAFLQLGARGVIATEAEIAANSAATFSEAFLAELASAKGEDGPSLAVLRTRRKVYSQYGNNLLPLLFYYVGNHGPYPSR